MAVGGANHRALGQAQQGRRPAANAQAHNQDLFALKLHRHLSFRVLMATKASTTAMIQKRTITLGSAQPFSSK